MFISDQIAVYPKTSKFKAKAELAPCTDQKDDPAMKLTIIAVGTYVLEAKAKYIDFHGQESFLDADILFLDPAPISALWQEAYRADDGRD